MCAAAVAPVVATLAPAVASKIPDVIRVVQEKAKDINKPIIGWRKRTIRVYKTGVVEKERRFEVTPLTAAAGIGVLGLCLILAFNTGVIRWREVKVKQPKTDANGKVIRDKQGNPVGYEDKTLAYFPAANPKHNGWKIGDASPLSDTPLGAALYGAGQFGKSLGGLFKFP